MTSEMYTAFLTLSGLRSKNGNQESVVLPNMKVIYSTLSSKSRLSIRIENSDSCIEISDDYFGIYNSNVVDLKVIGIENDVYYVQPDTDDDIQQALQDGLITSAEVVPRMMPSCFKASREVYKVKLCKSLQWDFNIPQQIAKYFSLPPRIMSILIQSNTTVVSE